MNGVCVVHEWCVCVCVCVSKEEIVGDAKDDQEYFSKISELLLKLTNKKPKRLVRKEKLGNSLRLHLYSKKFVEYIINDIDFSIDGVAVVFYKQTDDQFITDNFSVNVVFLHRKRGTI